MKSARKRMVTALLLAGLDTVSPHQTAIAALGDGRAADPATTTTAAPQPLPSPDLSGLDITTRTAITQAQHQLQQRRSGPASNSTGNAANNSTDKPDGHQAELAAAWARLAALYQHAAIDGAATTAWHNAATLQPDDYRWRYYQGWLALNSGHIPQALSAFQQARQRNPDYPPLALRIGQAWLADNQLEKATSELQQAAGHPGLRAAALYYLAQIALLQRDYPLALQQLNEARQLAPNAPGLHYPLAQALRGSGQREQAREQLALVPPGKPQAPAADDPLVNELTQVVHSAQPDFNQAMQAVRKRDYASAITHFQAGLAINPNSPDNWHARSSYARALWLAGEQQQARQQLHQVLEQHPQDALASFMLALMRQHDGKQEQAIQLYRQALSSDPKHQGAHYYLANLLFERGDYAAAASHYRAAQHGDSELPAARLLAILADYHASGNAVPAADELRTLIEKHPQQAELRYAQIRLYALSTDPTIHDDIAAVTLANQLLQDQPGPAPLAALALAVAANGQFKVAADIQQQLIERLQWSAGGEEIGQLQDTLNSYEAGELPTQAIWPVTDPMLQPPPFAALAPIREYLSAIPF